MDLVKAISASYEREGEAPVSPVTVGYCRYIIDKSNRVTW